MLSFRVYQGRAADNIELFLGTFYNYSSKRFLMKWHSEKPNQGMLKRKVP